jgi:hypothetical protein
MEPAARQRSAAMADLQVLDLNLLEDIKNSNSVECMQ